MLTAVLASNREVYSKVIGARNVALNLCGGMREYASDC